MPPYFYPVTQILPYMKIKEMNLFLTQGQIFCINWYSGRAMGRKSGTSKSKGYFQDHYSQNGKRKKGS